MRHALVSPIKFADIQVIYELYCTLEQARRIIIVFEIDFEKG